MATTEAGICNIALARIGQRQFIGSLDDATTQAEVAKTIFADARDAVLASAPWPFATRQLALGALPASFLRSGWLYAYSLPGDLITALRVYAGMRNPPTEARIPFAIEDADTPTTPSISRPLLLTDQVNAELIYIARVVSVGAFPPLFVDALAWKLACDFALALAVKPQVAAMMEQQYERALGRAATKALMQGQEDQPADADYIRARS